MYGTRNNEKLRLYTCTEENGLLAQTSEDQQSSNRNGPEFCPSDERVRLKKRQRLCLSGFFCPYVLPEVAINDILGQL